MREDSSSPARLWTSRALRWVLGILFIWAGSLKIIDAPGFAEALSYYRLLPMPGINWTAIFLPWLEVVCGVALITGVCDRGAAAWLAMMLVVFIAALGYSIHRGLDISCGCFGLNESGKKVGFFEIGRNLLLLAAAVAVFLLGKQPSVNHEPK